MERAETERLYGVALSRGAAIDRTGRGLLRLTGEQAIWFLQNTVTADVDDLPSGAWRESCFLNPKGKLVSHFRVGRLADEIWIDVDPPAGGLADWFVRYRFRTKVDIEDRSTTVTTVLGPPAAELARDGEIVVDDGTVIFGSRLGDLDVADVHGLLEREIERAPEELFEVFRIEAGVGAFGVDYTTDHLPQEAGLTAVVPIDKGCYVGQETVARIHFRGRINKVIRPLELKGVDEPVGRTLRSDGQTIGTITSAAWSPRRGDIAIGMVRVEPAAGAAAELDGGGTAIIGPVPAGTKVKTA